MDKNWFDSLIDEKGNWTVPKSGVKNLKEVAPKLYEEVMEEIRIRGAVSSSTTETKQCLQDSEVLGDRKVVLSEEEIEPCCGRPSCDGCKLMMEDEAWEKLNALGVDEYNKLIKKHGTPWDNGNKKLSLEPTTKDVKDDILTYMANKGCLPKFNGVNGDGEPFSRVKGNASVMANRDPKDYPENCECGKCDFSNVCNISCDCTVDVDEEEEDELPHIPSDWTLETEEDKKACENIKSVYGDKCFCTEDDCVDTAEDDNLCGCAVDAEEAYKNLRDQSPYADEMTSPEEDLAWDKVATRFGLPDVEKMQKIVSKEVERETMKTSGFNELTKLVREIATNGEENIVDSDLCELYSAYFDQFRIEAKNLLKQYNGFIDKDVYIHLLSVALYVKNKGEVIWLNDKQYSLFDDMYTARDVAKDVLDDLCEDEVLSWRNVLMTRKAYTRFVRMFSEFYSQKVSEKMFGTPLDIGCTFPRSWDKF